MINKELTTEEKKQLLKVFLNDEVYYKSIVETLSPQELDNWLDDNVESMLVKVGENF